MFKSKYFFLAKLLENKYKMFKSKRGINRPHSCLIYSMSLVSLSANTYKIILEEKRELFISFVIDVFIAIQQNRSDILQNILV